MPIPSGKETATSSQSEIHSEIDQHGDSHKAVEVKRRKPQAKRKGNLLKGVPGEDGAEKDQQLPEQHTQLPFQEGASTTSIQRELETQVTSKQMELEAPTTSSQGEFDPYGDGRKEVISKRRKPKMKRKLDFFKDVQEGNTESDQQLLRQDIQLPFQDGAPPTSIQSELEAPTSGHSELEACLLYTSPSPRDS